MNTKRSRIKLLTTISLSAILVIGIFLLIMSHVNASGIYYCENCGAHLTTVAQHMSNWSYSHNFRDPVNGKQTCRVECSVDRIYYNCPNGHGTKDIVDVTTEIHNHPLCTNR